jgi:hypothetical protein
MKRLWTLVAMVAVFPATTTWLVIAGDTRRLLEFLPLLACGTIAGTAAIVTLYRDGKRRSQ